jgi:monofunctional biosynthetic peptidoglycan transglycosylase
MARSPSPAPRLPFARRLFRTLLLLLLGLLGLTVLQTGALICCDPPVTVPALWAWAADRLQGKPARLALPRWRRLNEISPHLRRAVMAAEDQRFQAHHGFDLVEIEDAMREMITQGRMRGASTITMQAARSVFLPRSRSVLRKLIEAHYTVLMELMLTKARIYEIYLNTVHWGPGVLGAEAAARTWFGGDAAHIGPQEAALLAAILPNPEQWSPRRPGPHVRQRQRWILACMDNIPLIRYLPPPVQGR